MSNIILSYVHRLVGIESRCGDSDISLTLVPTKVGARKSDVLEDIK